MDDDFAFDILAYLDDKGIDVKKKGKDVGSGWVGIECPFPRCSDPGTHCGINAKTQAYKCWICGEHGHVIKLVELLEDCSWRAAIEIARKYPVDPFQTRRPAPSMRRAYQSQQCALPSEIEPVWPQIHLDYLISRGFDPGFLIQKYKLKPVYNIGDYRFRIIAPVFLDHKIVSFVAADVLRNNPNRLPYLDCPKSQAIIPNKQGFYNLDSVKDGKAIIVEGLTDVWRCGDGFIATFTSNYSQEQILLLVRKHIRKVFVLYDPDAIEKAQRLGNLLSGIIPSVERIRLDIRLPDGSKGDPADMTSDEVRYMRRDLLGHD
jgi:hypothetical protein